MCCGNTTFVNTYQRKGMSRKERIQNNYNSKNISEGDNDIIVEEIESNEQSNTNQ